MDLFVVRKRLRVLSVYLQFTNTCYEKATYWRQPIRLQIV